MQTKPPITINEAVVSQLQALEVQVILASELEDYADLRRDSTLSTSERFACRADIRTQMRAIADTLPSEESQRAHRRIARARAEEQCWRNWAADGGPRRSDAWSNSNDQAEVAR